MKLFVGKKGRQIHSLFEHNRSVHMYDLKHTTFYTDFVIEYMWFTGFGLRLFSHVGLRTNDF